MFCFSCDTELTARGSCPKCSLREDNHEDPSTRRSRIRWSIEKSAAKLGCEWTEVPNAVALARDLKLDEAELSADVAEMSFRHGQALLALTAEETIAIKRLSDAGLHVSRNDTGPFRQGFSIYKPVAVAGNSRPGTPWGMINEDGEDQSDAPLVRLFPTRDLKWVFLVAIGCGGKLPGDFDEEYDSLPEAAASIYDYFFGDPGKMTPPGVIERFERYGH